MGLRTAASVAAAGALLAGATALLFGAGMADAGGVPDTSTRCSGRRAALPGELRELPRRPRRRELTAWGPSLLGVGAQAADFELSTGRMPLAVASAEPVRSKPAFSDAEMRSLVAYIGSLGGPGIPQADPAKGSVVAGRELFASNCASCHQITGSGGVVPGASVPSLQSATPTQIAEAVRMGPYLMPRFSAGELTPRQVDGIAALRALDPIAGGSRRVEHRPPRPRAGGPGRLGHRHRRAAPGGRADHR